MADFLVIVPSRGRPERLADFVSNFSRMTTAHTSLLVAVDEDDPELADYAEAVHWLGRCLWRPDLFNVIRTIGARRLRMVGIVNHLARAMQDQFTYVGFMGDDHFPRTKGWDREYVMALRDLDATHGAGIVFGDDKIHGPNLPTQVAMSTSIVRALGYMIPPDLVHLYADNAWLDWGRGSGILRYLPDVTVEHMHPLAGKSESDGTYVEANSHMDEDAKRYESYKTDGRLDVDLDRIRALRP